MLSNPIKTKNYLEHIVGILGNYDLSQDNLEITTSTFSWANKRGIKSVTRDILAFSTIETHTDTDEKKPIIVLLAKMPLGDVNSVLSRIDFKSKKPTNLLNTDKKFIEHLVLHEIGHLVKGLSQANEEKADDFAFQEMGLSNATSD